MSRACVRAVRALSVAAGTQQPAARPVSLLPAPQPPHQASYHPPLSLCGLHSKFPWQRRLCAAAGAKTPRWRAILGVSAASTCSAPNPPERRFPTWREQGEGCCERKRRTQAPNSIHSLTAQRICGVTEENWIRSQVA